MTDDRLDRQALISELGRTRSELKEKLLYADRLICCYREALEWYAEPGHYYPSTEHKHVSPVDKDGGTRARAVLGNWIKGRGAVVCEEEEKGLD